MVQLDFLIKYTVNPAEAVPVGKIMFCEKRNSPGYFDQRFRVSLEKEFANGFCYFQVPEYRVQGDKYAFFDEVVPVSQDIRCTLLTNWVYKNFEKI